MQVNQMGEPLFETELFARWTDSATDADRDEAIYMILCYLKCTIVRTNATKHGYTELVLKEDGDEDFVE